MLHSDLPTYCKFMYLVDFKIYPFRYFGKYELILILPDAFWVIKYALLFFLDNIQIIKKKNTMGLFYTNFPN